MLYKSFRVALTLGFIFLTQPLFSQVSLMLHTEKGNRVFFNVAKSKLELKNGKLNMALLSKKAKIFELNGIPERYIIDTVAKIIGTSAIYITDTITYKSILQRGNVVEIKCKESKEGEPISITASGKMYYGKRMLLYELSYKGVLPKKQNVKTN